jgi:hypothetical protein
VLLQCLGQEEAKKMMSEVQMGCVERINRLTECNWLSGTLGVIG